MVFYDESEVFDMDGWLSTEEEKDNDAFKNTLF
jgi:hypothetical protein